MSVSESGMSGALRVGVPRLFCVVSDVTGRVSFGCAGTAGYAVFGGLFDELWRVFGRVGLVWSFGCFWPDNRWYSWRV